MPRTRAQVRFGQQSTKYPSGGSTNSCLNLSLSQYKSVLLAVENLKGQEGRLGPRHGPERTYIGVYVYGVIPGELMLFIMRAINPSIA